MEARLHSTRQGFVKISGRAEVNLPELTCPFAALRIWLLDDPSSHYYTCKGLSLKTNQLQNDSLCSKLLTQTQRDFGQRPFPGLRGFHAFPHAAEVPRQLESQVLQKSRSVWTELKHKGISANANFPVYTGVDPR